MAALKVYGVGNDGFVSPAVIAALGLPRHIRQVSVSLIAASKAEAVRVAESVGFRLSPHSADFRVERSPWADSLLAHFDTPVVVVTAMVGNPGNGAILQLVGRDETVRIGAVGRDGRGSSVLFPKEG